MIESSETSKGPVEPWGLETLKIPARLICAGAAALVMVSCLIALTRFGSQDESWFLRVLQRVTDGEVLYRDVYYPLLPLPVYIGAAATSLLGVHFLVLQTLFFATFVVEVWICDSVARALRCSSIARVLLVVSLCVVASPAAKDHVVSLYEPVATAGLLLCLHMALAWSARREGRLNFELVIAAVASGVSFAAKDQVGGLALAALGVGIAVMFWERRFPVRQLIQTGLTVLALFSGTVLLTLIPVVAQGAFQQFADAFMFERLNFIETASISYGDGIWEFVRLLATLAFIEEPLAAVHYSLFLVAPAVAVLLGVMCVLHAERTTAAMILAFLLAAFLSIFPRADIWHVLYVSAMICVAFVYVADKFLRSPFIRNAVFAFCFVSLAVAFAEAIWASTVRVVYLDYDFLRLPHFAYAMAPRARIEQMTQDRDRLLAAATTGPVFLLTDEAGFYYLITGIRNPTPIDYPMVASMGPGGESGIIRSIQSQPSAWACVRSYREPRLRPVRVEAFIRTQMQFVDRLGFCDLYRWE